jgi:DNA-binding transcriptional regulator LsrR (DeoR family)
MERRPPPRHNQVQGTDREIEVIERVLNREKKRDIARSMGVDRKTVERVAKKNADLIRRRQEELQLYIHEKFSADREEQLASWLATSKNGESRAQPQMADVLLKAMGLGQKNGIHIGDVYNQTANVQVNAKYASEHDPDLEAKLRAELGLGRVVDVPVESERDVPDDE